MGVGRLLVSGNLGTWVARGEDVSFCENPIALQGMDC
jgi:hypothetical protein